MCCIVGGFTQHDAHLESELDVCGADPRIDGATIGTLQGANAEDEEGSEVPGGVSKEAAGAVANDNGAVEDEVVGAVADSVAGDAAGAVANAAASAGVVANEVLVGNGMGSTYEQSGCKHPTPHHHISNMDNFPARVQSFQIFCGRTVHYGTFAQDCSVRAIKTKHFASIDSAPSSGIFRLGSFARSCFFGTVCL